MVQSVLFENLPYTSKKHTFRNREEIVNSNVLVFKNSRIGIGTQEPEENYRVTISGNTVIRGTLTAEILSYTASNLNHLTIDNLGTQEGINLIQRGYDPFITFRSNEYGIVNIIDGKGNVGIGTSIAYESLVVQGKVVAKDLLLTGESIYQKPLQVPPIHQTFIVQDRADLDFLVETDGIYAASNEDVEVYLNGYKLAYYNSNLKDYVVSYSNEYNPPKTYFNITLTSVAKSQDVIDITFWPRTLDQVQGTLGGYSTQSIYSYWDKALDNSVYYSGNVGVGTYKAMSKLDVRGRVTATEFYGSGAGLSNVPGAFEKINQRDSVYMLGNIGIGTTFPRQKLDVQGNIFSSGSIVCSNINALGTFTVLNTISSNTDRMVIENINTSIALQVTQTGLNFPIAVFEKTCNEAVLFIDNTGKVGINTNSPIESLDIRGNVYVSGNIQCSNISTIGEFTTITTATNQTEQLIVVNAGTSTAFKVTQNGYNKVAEFFQSNISLLQVAYDGNIGIGTDVPVEKLDVRGNILGSNLRLAGTSVSIQTHPTAILNLQAGLIQVQSDILPTACNVYNLGSSNYRFKDLYLSGNTIDLDGTRIQKDSLTGGIQIVNQQGVSLDVNSKSIYTSNVGIGTTISLQVFDVNGISYFRSNVGIGTLNPTRALDVYGSGYFQSNLDIKGSVTIGTGYPNYQNSGSNGLILPASSGIINGVNITALNKRTRTSYAAANECVNQWTFRDVPSGDWKSICWSSELGLFVSVSQIGVMISSDSIKWSLQSIPLTVDESNEWISVCWSPELGIFVAVSQTGTGDRVMTSPNGITWTLRASPADIEWQSICWSPELGIFVAVSQTGTNIPETNSSRVMTSSDGINWTLRTAFVGAWKSICWSAELNRFVATGNSRVMSSLDGITWTLKIVTSGTWQSVCWSPELGIFVSVPFYGSSGIIVSSDGINWTTYPGIYTYGNIWITICWSPELSLFVASGTVSLSSYIIMTSPNGIHWTLRSAPSLVACYSICWSPELSIFAIVTLSSTVMTSAIGMPNSKSVVKALPSQIYVNPLGNVGIGTTLPQQLLDVRGNIYSSGTITCSNISIIGDFVTMNTITSNTEQMVIENAGTGPALKVTQTGVNSLAEFYDKESGIALYINNGGNVGIGTNVTTAKLYVAGQIYATENITAFSDATYKTNIQRIPNALEKLTNVHGYTFNKLNDPNGKSYMGVLAQEIEPVFPELIEKQGDTLSVAYGNMVAPLIEMIHELKQRVEALERAMK